MNLDLPDVKFHDHKPVVSNFAAEALQGLRSTPKTISPKFFYDEKGSRLFEAICETPEYYVTRTELAIIRQNAAEIAECIGKGCLLIEPGSGNSRKVRELLDEVRPVAYLPVDISGDFLLQEARKLAREFSWLEVHAVCSDFTRTIELPVWPHAPRKVAFFPGSSIGNFEPADATGFLAGLRQLVEDDGGLLIGVDLKKDKAVLDNAYNDAAGITAEFNLNLLHRMNAELDADFAIDAFRHKAFYNEAAGRIEMHLMSTARQSVTVCGELVSLEQGESIHTENSYKYSVDEFCTLASTAGFSHVKSWADERQHFALMYFESQQD